MTSDQFGSVNSGGGGRRRGMKKEIGGEGEGGEGGEDGEEEGGWGVGEKQLRGGTYKYVVCVLWGV